MMRRAVRGFPIAVAGLLALSSASAQAVHEFELEAQPLDKALNAFALQSGLNIYFNPTDVQGKSAPEIRMAATPSSALSSLLAGTELKAVYVNEKTVRLAQAETPSGKSDGEKLDEVTVTSNYYSSSSGDSTVGPWEGRQLQDLPYSIGVISVDLIENLQATNPDQVYKIVPKVQIRFPYLMNDTPQVQLRGLPDGATARNGLTGPFFTHGTAMEDVERIEILTGASGFMYGPANVGGLINYVIKRPTTERLNFLTLGYTGGSNFYAHGDFGGPIDSDGRFGYRINAVTQDGETWVNDLDLRKKFISGAFDFKINERLLLQIDGSYKDMDKGRQAYWALASGVRRPAADTLDPAELWGQKWNFSEVESERLGSNIRWEVNDAVNVRAAYLHREDIRTDIWATNTIQSNGTYSQASSSVAPQYLKGSAWQAFADIKFSTGPITHKVTAGYMAAVGRRFDHVDGSAPSPALTGLPLSAPSYVPEPVFNPHGQQPTWKVSDSQRLSAMIGDDIAFNDRWSILVGLNRATIDAKSRSTPAAAWSAYKKSATTPTASVIYKPAPHITSYVTYMEALEQGGTAADLFNGIPVANARLVMDPLISEEIEIGVKASVGGMELTGALFQIDKSLQYYDVSIPTQPTYVQDGLQVHRGLEITATGKPSPRLTLVGGVTVLDARVRKQKQDPTLEGKVPVGSAEQLFKIYGEYEIPGLSGLTLNAGLSHNGAAWGNAANTDSLPSYTVLDVGARYATSIADRPFTLRLNVSNLTDERYWFNELYLGDSRTVLFSANLRF